MRLIISALLLFASTAQALSLGPPVEGTQGQLASQHYQPFTGLKIYSALGWFTCYAMSQEFRKVDDHQESVYPGVDIGSIVGVSGLLVMLLTSGPRYANEPAQDYNPDQIDVKDYDDRRKRFFFSSGLLAVSDVIMAASSGAPNKWTGLGIGLAGPLVLDAVLRPLLYRDRLSPYTTVSPRGDALVGVSYSY